MADLLVFSLISCTKLQLFIENTNRFMQRVKEYSQRADKKGRTLLELKTF